MAVVGSPVQSDQIESPSRASAGFRRFATVIPVLGMSVIWAIVTFHASRLRSIVTTYEAAYGEARLPSSGLRPNHLQVFHDDLMAVRADYFYPFGPAMLIVVAALWACALAFARTESGGLRRWLGGLGLVALATQLALFAGALETYVHITD